MCQFKVEFDLALHINKLNIANEMLPEMELAC